MPVKSKRAQLAIRRIYALERANRLSADPGRYRHRAGAYDIAADIIRDEFSK